MLEAYSTDITVAADAVVPFNNVTVEKGCTAILSAPGTINLNKCGVYLVSVDATAEASTTIQLYKNGIAQPQAQATGTAISFSTLVQVNENNSCCPCDSATALQVINTTAGTFTNINCCVTKVC